MSSATKTLELLDYFSPARPEVGLSELSRLSGRDKATTYRRLQSLEQTGFVEQNPLTKRYRLGPALLQLAQTREITVPRKAAAAGPLHDLVNATGETSHVSVISGTTLYNLIAVESSRYSTRVIVDIQTFPLHATSSGLCALAFANEDMLDVAKENLTSFTPNTVFSVDALHTTVKTISRTGFAWAHGSFESDVYSLAAPVFDQTGFFAGTVSTASVATRFTPELENIVKTNLITASREITHNWGGTVPEHIERAWAKTLAPIQETEATL